MNNNNNNANSNTNNYNSKTVQQQRSAPGRASNTLSILSKSDSPLVIEKNSVVQAGTGSAIQDASSHHLVHASSPSMAYPAAHIAHQNGNNNNNNNSSPIMSSRTSRNSKTSYVSIASTLRYKSNRIVVNSATATGSMSAGVGLNVNAKKPPETFFEDPLYKAKQMKKQRRADIQKRFNDPIVNPGKAKAKPKSVKQGYFDEGVQGATGGDYKIARCNLTFIFDPNGRLSYYMSMQIEIFQ
jgi:hypothetical protein